MRRERWLLTVRAGSRVERDDFATLAEAVDALERRIATLVPEATRDEVQFLGRRIEPVQQVAARLEVAGPGGWRTPVRGGVDLRGDGSAEAFTGRTRRAIVEQRDGESAAQALRRALAT